MDVIPEVQYSALAILAIFMVIVLRFAASYIDKSSQFVQDLTLKSMASLEGVGDKFSEAQIAVSTALRTLNEEVVATQSGMQSAMEAMEGAIVTLAEEERDRQKEHAQLLEDHQMIMASLKRIEEGGPKHGS